MQPAEAIHAFAGGPVLGPLLDRVSDLVFLARVDGHDQYSLADVNQAYLDLVGLPKETLLAMRMDQLVPPDGLEFIKARYREALEKREPIRYEENVTLASGRLFFDALLPPIFDVAGST